MRASGFAAWSFVPALWAACGVTEGPALGTSPADLDRTPSPDLDAPAEPCEGLPTEMRVLGTIFTPLGHPVGAGVDVYGDGATAAATTDAVGRYQIMLPGPGAITLGGRWSWPERSCVGVPPKFTVLGPEGAQIRMNMRDIHLVTSAQCPREVQWGDEDARWVIAETPRGPERLGRLAPGTLAIPCDTQSLTVLGPADAATFTDVQREGPWAIPLRPATTRAVRLMDASGNPMEGVADTPWGPIPTAPDGTLDLAWPDEASPLYVRAAGHVPGQPSASGELRLQPSRPLEVRCAGHAADRCEELPIIEVGGSRFPCRHDSKGRATCDRPADTAAVVFGGGLAVGVASTEDVAWIDHRAIAGAIDLAHTTGRCDVWALREVRGARKGPTTTFVNVPCSASGTTRIAPLSTGTWEVTVLDDVGRSRQRIEVGSAPVAAQRAEVEPWQ